MSHPHTKALAGLVALLTTALLVGNRFGFTWAGGKGYQPHGMLELIRQEGAFREYKLNNIRIFLDEQSEIELKDGRAGHETIRFITGRILVNGPLTVTVRETSVTLAGTTTLVNYSWLDTLHVAAIAGTWSYCQHDTCGTGNTDMQLDTLPPYHLPIQKELRRETVQTFYDWTQSQ